MNYGQTTPEQHQWELQAAQRATLPGRWDRERRDEAERANREHMAAAQRWQAQMIEQGLMTHPNAPVGPKPPGVSTETRLRALPDVHQALRANDPKAPHSQPVVAKKAPPTTRRGAFQNASNEEMSLQGLVQVQFSKLLQARYLCQFQ